MSLIEGLWKLLERLPVVEVLRERDVRRYEHDRGKFAELEKLFAEEALELFLKQHDQLSLERHVLGPVRPYLEWQKRARNQFLIHSVQKTHKAFAESLEQLWIFSAAHFFQSDSHADLFVFHPDQNPDHRSVRAIDRRLFEDLRAELHGLVRNVDETWDAFRTTVKRSLQV